MAKHNGSRGYTVTTTPQRYLEENHGRSSLMIQNNGAAALLVGLGSAPVAGQCIQVAANTIWNPVNPPTDAIYLAASSATLAVVVAQG